MRPVCCQAGHHFARTFVTRELNYANPTIDAEPRSARRNDNVRVINVRVDRAINIGTARLSPFLDRYNVTNANPIQDITVNSGGNVLRPTVIVSPCIIRIGARFDW